MQRLNFSLKRSTVITVMLCASLFSLYANAKPRSNDDTLLIHGHAPYIKKIAPVGELYEGNTISLAPNSGRIYEPFDIDLDIKALDTESDTYPGDLTLEGNVIEWWLLSADYQAQTLPLNATPENLTGEFAGAELIADQRQSEVVLPVGSAGKKLGFRVIPRSMYGLPTLGQRLDVLDVAYLAGQTEGGDPIVPTERGPATGPDPDNPGIIGGPTNVTYYTRIYTYVPTDAQGEIPEIYDPMQPAGQDTTGKKVFLWDETGLTPEEEIKPFADTHTTYYAQIVSFTNDDISQDNLVDNTEQFKDTIVWRLKLEEANEESQYIRLDGTQTTTAQDAEAIDTTGQITFTTQFTNKKAQVATGAQRSEQGTRISFVYDDGQAAVNPITESNHPEIEEAPKEEEDPSEVSP